MATEKKPFHEVLSWKLATAPIGITSALSDCKATEMLTILSILQESKMPAAMAHQIAATHAHLPTDLSSVGVHPDIIKLVEEALDDLRSRKDEKNAEGPSPRDMLMAADPSGPRTV